MSFKMLVKSTERLTTMLEVCTGRRLVADVSLEPPDESQGEAAFLKAVLWCYVLWFEACQPAGRHLSAIVRNSSPQDHKIASRAFQDVQNLRTYQAHNLISSSKSDQHKASQAKTWLIENGGSEGDWDRCTEKICFELANALDILRSHWIRLTDSPEDAGAAVNALVADIERNWESHLFDKLVEQVAASIELLDFDVPAYRKKRVEAWRQVADLFEDRASAESAVRRAIRQELLHIFGASQK